MGQIYILFLPDPPTCLLLSLPQAFLDPGFSTISVLSQIITLIYRLILTYG